MKKISMAALFLGCFSIPGTQAATFNVPFFGAADADITKIRSYLPVSPKVVTVKGANGTPLEHSNGMYLDGETLRSVGNQFRESFWVTLDADGQLFRLHYTPMVERKVLMAGFVTVNERYINIYPLPFEEDSTGMITKRDNSEMHRVYFPITKLCIWVDGGGINNPKQTEEYLTIKRMNEPDCK